MAIVRILTEKTEGKIRYNKTILLKLKVKNMKEAILLYAQKGDLL